MVDGGAQFYDTIQSLSKYPPFVNATARLPETMVEQRANEELVLRFFALMTARRMFKGNIEEWLDGFMEEVLFRRITFDINMETDKFKKTFDFICSKFSDSAFTRFNPHGEPTGRLAPAYFEAVCAAVVENFEQLTNLDEGILLERLKKAFSSPEFKDSTGPGANTIPKLTERINVVSRYLVQINATH
jgi:hypothetical protein